ncbi:MAG TPA: UDP-glucose/GDP-mannose dehydrogenase family protein [Sorangium sp.]|nr:UDP-glucose/GDP-mannose dehydrogenase family protein [Sorangium sp.]
MHIVVVGTGYVGLVTAAGFADFGNEVVCVGDDAERIAQLSAGKLPLYEPGLGPLLEENRVAGRVRFTTDLQAALHGCEVVFLALHVPVTRERGADLSALFAAADQLAETMTDGCVVVTKSTVPVGTADRIRVRIEARSEASFTVVSNPAFLKVGAAVSDFMRPDRVLIGSDDERAIDMLRGLYAPFVRTRDRVFVVDARSAELAKYAASALLASRISFMNELALLADDLGADIEAVRQVMGADRRIGPKALFVGPGFGGTNFHNDLTMLMHTAAEAGQPFALLHATDNANERQKGVLLRKLSTALGGTLMGKRIAIWGVAFKPRTDDIGQAPALRLMDGLLEKGAQPVVHDPRALDNVRRRYGERLHYAADMYSAAEEADALVLVTEWHQYRSPDFARLRRGMAGQLLVDGRNVWNRECVRELGFRYVGIGRS